MPPPTTIVMKRPDACSVYLPTPSVERLKMTDHMTDVQMPISTKQNAPTADAVDNQSTLDNLNKAIANAQSINTTATCSADMKTNELKTNTTSFKDAAKEAKDAKKSIEQALDAATNSKDSKNTNALKADLNANISTAQTTLNDSAGKVADESTRTALQDAISNANNVADRPEGCQGLR